MKNNVPKLSLEKIYNQFAIFFLGTVLFVVLLYYGNELARYSNFIPQIFTLTIFSCYFSNLASFSIYYLTKASKGFRDSYEKHTIAWIICFVTIFFIFILIGGYFLVGIQKLSELVISTLLFGGLAIVGWIVKSLYDSKIKKKIKRWFLDFI